MTKSSQGNDQEWEGFLASKTHEGVEILKIVSGKKSLVSTPAVNEDKNTSTDWIASGTNDAFLTEMRDVGEKSTVIMPGIRFNANMHFGGGLDYGTITAENGVKKFVSAYDEKVEKFLKRNKWFEQIYTSLLDLEAFGFAVMQFGTNLNGTEIARMTSQFTRASWCRFSRRDKNGDIPFVHVSADFGKPDFKKEKVKKIKCAPEYIGDDWYIEQKKSKKVSEFCYIMRIPDLGKSYYPNPDWYTSVNSGWYDVAQYIVEAKKFLFKNQFNVKYHIEFHPSYWPSIVGTEKWAKMKVEEKAQFKNDELDRIVKALQGSDKSGSTLFSEMNLKTNGEVESLLKINELKNSYMADGAFMKESNESSDHMLSALGIHPELIGNAPGSKMGAGSGSASRVAFNQRVSMALIFQLIVLDALRIVSEYNGWNYEWQVRNSLITTLDTGAEATKPSTNLPN